MCKVSEWKLAKKLQENDKCTAIIAAVVIVLAIIGLVAVIVIKLEWLKRQFGCCMECEMDMLDEDFMENFGDDDISEDDFV